MKIAVRDKELATITAETAVTLVHSEGPESTRLYAEQMDKMAVVKESLAFQHMNASDKEQYNNDAVDARMLAIEAKVKAEEANKGYLKLKTDAEEAMRGFLSTLRKP